MTGKEAKEILIGLGFNMIVETMCFQLFFNLNCILWGICRANN